MGSADSTGTAMSPAAKQEQRTGHWSPAEHARFLEGLNKYGNHGRGKWDLITEHVETRNRKQVYDHAQTYLKKLAKTAAPSRAPAGVVDTPKSPAAPVDAQGDVPAQSDSHQDASFVTAPGGDSATFGVIAMNTKGGGGTDKQTKKSVSARLKKLNPGITQPPAEVFRESMALFLSDMKRRFGSVLPAAWLLTEVAWVLGGDNMKALSQRAPDGARSTLDKEAAVIWGGECAEGAEALTLQLLDRDRKKKKFYVDVQKAGESIYEVNLEHLDHADKDKYERMLERVAAARLTLPVGQCLFLSYHGPSTGFDDDKKCRFLGWLLQLARSLADLLGIPVVLGGDLNLDVRKHAEKLGEPTEGTTLVGYTVNQRRARNVVDWLYLINPRNGHTRLEYDKCVAVDPAQPYREKLAAEGVTLHPNWFDHDALLAVLRLVVCRQTA